MLHLGEPRLRTGKGVLGLRIQGPNGTQNSLTSGPGWGWSAITKRSTWEQAEPTWTGHVPSIFGFPICKTGLTTPTCLEGLLRNQREMSLRGPAL